jgi:hypothetical protein
MIDATAPHTRVDNFVIDEYLDRVVLQIYTSSIKSASQIHID